MDVTPSSMAEAGVTGVTNFSWESTSSLHAHSEGCFGLAAHPRTALFGLSVEKKLQLTRTPVRGCWGVARPKPGVKKGAGLMLMDVTPAAWLSPGPQAQSTSPRKQPAIFTPTQKAALAQLEPHGRAFLGLAWTSSYS